MKIEVRNLKESISALAFYRHELPSMPEPRRVQGWANGGLCCFHDDTRPNSFFVNLESGAFVCFSCGAKGGDIVEFLKQRDGVSFREAVESIAGEWGVSA